MCGSLSELGTKPVECLPSEASIKLACHPKISRVILESVLRFMILESCSKKEIKAKVF